MLVERVGTTPEQAQRCLELATIRVEDTSFVEQVRALGVERRAARPGPRGARRRRRGLPCRRRRPGRRRGQPPHRARPGLLHRHRRRGLHGGLRAPQVGRRGRALRRARQRRPDDLPRRRRLLRRLPHPHPAHRRRRARRRPAGAQRRPGRAQRRGGPRRQHRGRRAPSAPATSPARSRRRPAKFGKQIRFAERRGIPYVWFVQADGTSQVKDIRSGDQVDADPATWAPPGADLRPRIISTPSRPTSAPQPPQINEENQ